MSAPRRGQLYRRKKERDGWWSNHYSQREAIRRKELTKDVTVYVSQRA